MLQKKHENCQFLLSGLKTGGKKGNSVKTGLSGISHLHVHINPSAANRFNNPLKNINQRKLKGKLGTVGVLKKPPTVPSLLGTFNYPYYL